MNSNLILILTVMLATTLKTDVAWAKKATRAPASIAAQQAVDYEPSLAELQRDLRLQHARELLGKYYEKSPVRVGENIKKIDSRIYTWTRERLPQKYKKSYKKVAEAVIYESLRHHFDPVFVLSVIQNESTFNPGCLGSLDEIGLMQLRPATAEWIAKKYDIPYKGAESLFDPVVNIRIGTAYMDYLRDGFDSHAQLYLAAYNMGKRSVNLALEKNIWPKDYAGHVMKFYVDFYNEIKDAKEAKRKKPMKDKVASL
jgi:soluble lytic murein transglycosylase